MKKHLFCLAVILCPLFVFSQISIIGTATPAVDWTTDFDLDQDPTNPSVWTGQILLQKDSLFKFRANNDWAINWGADNFPAGPLIVNGNNIMVDSTATYHMTFDSTALTYAFIIADIPTMTLTEDGRVGIGTLYPMYKLDVNGDVNVAGTISGVIDPVNAQDAATKAYVDTATSIPIYTIGLSAEQGGYIFWVSADGKHGLVAETIDQSSSSNWYNAQDKISNPSNHSANAENFRDWRMPTKYELNEMYLQKDDIGGFSGVYWSSTEEDESSAWGQIFLTGVQYDDFKFVNVNVRAVRVF